MGSVCYMTSIVPRPKMYEQARTSLNRTNLSKGRISPYTQQTTPFPSGSSLLMRIEDDWCRMVKASSRPRAWLGKGWIGSLSAAVWSANSGCNFGSSLTQFFFAPRYTAALKRSKSTRIVIAEVRVPLFLSVVACSSRSPT